MRDETQNLEPKRADRAAGLAVVSSKLRNRRASDVFASSRPMETLA